LTSEQESSYSIHKKSGLIHVNPAKEKSALGKKKGPGRKWTYAGRGGPTN